ncbi:recombinase family protein [Mucilaginibacter phyllosphaerae]|uniref:DNA invertase Pin-like site-specific DNA recombinase n=1 Tax=Mucilaginibacter phyllosphaerae TaxID=1812349 RepID=A0A4Y8ABJ2_9SPHI|nr:recombinase family protein [Mucilaginibacter phyllosphaerae]MBB3969322.1 DNA invertase Pin-like site-specific DNA recombinase [Mucilaginibacter phyllosphaerae]TEW65885.1 recombinase family protein [Mucilaginibacter phyllosphaerae]GGH07685.1 resolvase [Mucilaginibacter phyllosphaerae]
MKQAIAYYRVSTGRQGRSGLGLEAQQSAVEHYCKANDYQLLNEVTEVRSTRKYRAGLFDALDLCKQNKASLVVARLDRLGRDVEQIARIFNPRSKIEVKVVDNPYANLFTIHILAAVAEDQRQRISETTKEALKAARSRGVELGKNGKMFLSVANRQAAEDFARKMSPVIQRFKNRGIITERAVCNELNKKSIPTFRHVGKWHRSSVHTLMTRINKQEEEQKQSK